MVAHLCMTLHMPGYRHFIELNQVLTLQSAFRCWQGAQKNWLLTRRRLRADKTAEAEERLRKVQEKRNELLAQEDAARAAAAAAAAAIKDAQVQLLPAPGELALLARSGERRRGRCHAEAFASCTAGMARAFCVSE